MKRAALPPNEGPSSKRARCRSQAVADSPFEIDHLAQHILLSVLVYREWDITTFQAIRLTCRQWNELVTGSFFTALEDHSRATGEAFATAEKQTQDELDYDKGRCGTVVLTIGRLSALPPRPFAVVDPVRELTLLWACSMASKLGCANRAGFVPVCRSILDFAFPCGKLRDRANVTFDAISTAKDLIDLRTESWSPDERQGIYPVLWTVAEVAYHLNGKSEHDGLQLLLVVPYIGRQIGYVGANIELEREEGSVTFTRT